MRPDEAWFLKEMNYQALYVPSGGQPFPYSIMDTPKLMKYYDQWGRKGDIAIVLVNETTDQLVGAAWARTFSKENRGYGFVDEHIPEMGIAITPEERGRGFGTELLEELIREVKNEGYHQISLSVDSNNPAIELYKRMGFRIVNSEGNPTMLLDI